MVILSSYCSISRRRRRRRRSHKLKLLLLACLGILLFTFTLLLLQPLLNLLASLQFLGALLVNRGSNWWARWTTSWIHASTTTFFSLLSYPDQSIKQINQHLLTLYTSKIIRTISRTTSCGENNSLCGRRMREWERESQHNTLSDNTRVVSTSLAHRLDYVHHYQSFDWRVGQGIGA